MATKPTTAKDSEAARREQMLAATLSQIEKQYGKGTVMKLGEVADVDIKGVSTGSISLDLALGGVGIPKGRIIEIFGPESSGKTTLALHVIASAQKGGGVCAFIDAEHALDPTYARRIGVNVDELLVSQPDTGEQALDIAEMLVKSNAVDVIVIDSVAALVPKAELEGEMGDSFVGLQARLMSQALRKLTGVVHKSNTSLLFINQLREKIGVMFGSPETTSGGKALKFYASIRIDVRRIGKIKDGDNVTGNRTKATVVKNKLAAPFQMVEFDIMYNEGISLNGDLIDLGTEKGILEKSGTWISYAEERLGQGRDRAKQYLVDNPAIAKRLYDEIMAKCTPKPKPVETPQVAAIPETPRKTVATGA